MLAAGAFCFPLLLLVRERVREKELRGMFCLDRFRMIRDILSVDRFRKIRDIL